MDIHIMFLHSQVRFRSQQQEQEKLLKRLSLEEAVGEVLIFMEGLAAVAELFMVVV
jgi:hypothetical protein